ncbi:MAG TPA: lipoyl(octanoyl) transferase LipB [Planctomycetes bacterium]|nr:lipoyl(octanoyl) transferase LipB [Planctomycetota bacterium]
MNLQVLDLGHQPYLKTLQRMREMVQLRARDEIPDCLLLVEHDPVVTAGRRADPSDVLDPGIEVVEIERGGRHTYHGPGQLVAYPICKLEGRARDLHAFLHLLEDVLIACLAEFGIQAGRNELGTGVYVEGRKIASIGIAVRRWVTYHGLALNVRTELSAFRAIRPCGISAELMTTMAWELGDKAPTLPQVAGVLSQCFREALEEYKMRRA